MMVSQVKCMLYDHINQFKVSVSPFIKLDVIVKKSFFME